MKRAWMKKVNAVPTNANNATEEQLKPVQPKVRRRLRTSVAMFGLAISIGGPTLLLTRHDRVPAAEKPLGDEPITSTVVVASAADTSAQEAPSTAVVEAVAAPVPVMQPPPVVVEAIPVQPQSSVAPTSVMPEVNAPQSRPQALATTSSSIDQNLEPLSASPAPDSPKATARQQRLVQKLKAAKTPVAAVNNEQLQKVELPVSSSHQSDMSRKQKLLVNRLKQSNHPQQSSAKLRFEESKPSIASESLPLESTQAIAPTQATPIENFQQPAPALPSTSTSWEQRTEITRSVPQQPQYTAPTRNQPTTNIPQSQSVETQTPASVSRLQARLAAVKRNRTSVGNAAPSEGNSVVVETSESLAAKLQPQVGHTNTPANPIADTPQTPTAVEIPTAPTDAIARDNTATAIATPIEPQPSSEPSQVASTQTEETAPVYVITTSSDSNQSQVQVGIAASAIDYQVKRGDTLSAIARKHRVSLSELVSANQITNPDRLEVAQSIVIPTEEYSTTTDQTIAIINRPPQPDTRVASNASNQLAHEQSVRPTSTLISTDSYSSSVLTGMGGSLSNQEPLDPPSFYAQALQADIQRLRQKYNAQQSQATPNKSVSDASSLVVEAKSIPMARPSRRPTAQPAEPINPEFRVAQTTGATTTKARLATAPTSVDPTEALQALRGRQVSPELPPLGAIDIYLPKPNAAPFKGYIWPAKGVLTSGYGWRWGRMHRGIDVAAPVGTPIVAAASGVVVRAGWNSGGYGKLVDIRHADGSLTRYAHNNRILVRPGQQVEQGKQIAEMGSTGFSTGPHLHFEVHASGKGAINPIAMLPRR